MNLPNKLTLLRIIMIPVFVVLLYLDFPFNNLVALAVFILASITDTLDGYIARKHNLITDFGKFMDPIADKLLVTAAMLVFVDWHMMPAWVVIVVVAREFIVSALRLVAANNCQYHGLYLHHAAGPAPVGECCLLRGDPRHHGLLRH